MDSKALIEEARRVLSEESSAVARLAGLLDENFSDAVRMIYQCAGRVIVTGMGKSGLIGKKITSTLASTGTPAVFLHPAEGVHGDLGVITDHDVAIAISYSGETSELLAILPFFKRFGVKIIAMCGDPDSTLGKSADSILNVNVEKEACPLGITPTSSSTATLAMGDALAMALIRMRNFKREDFAIRHPGGSLGRQLLLRVADLVHTGKDIPIVKTSVSLREAIYEMSRKRLGLTTVVDDAGVLVGIITDGDLRRIFERENGAINDQVSKVMTKPPKTIAIDAMAMEALRIMEEHKITALVTVDSKGAPSGIIHIHDILKAGLK
jgi:arabinose-5-phosphate isomerase